MIKTYAYQRATVQQLNNCLKWTLNLLQMRDWQVEIVINDDHEDYGNTQADIFNFKGTIWLNLKLCKKDNVNPYSTLIHEATHIFTRYRMNLQEMEDESIIRTLEPILYREWCRDNKRKEAREC